MEHLGDAGHADATNTDEMDGPERGGQFHGARLLIKGSTSGVLEHRISEPASSIGNAEGAGRASLPFETGRIVERSTEPFRQRGRSEIGLGHDQRTARSRKSPAIGSLILIQRAGKGTRIEPRPMTESSATVEARHARSRDGRPRCAPAYP